MDHTAIVQVMNTEYMRGDNIHDTDRNETFSFHGNGDIYHDTQYHETKVSADDRRKGNGLVEYNEGHVTKPLGRRHPYLYRDSLSTRSHNGMNEILDRLRNWYSIDLPMYQKLSHVFIDDDAVIVTSGVIICILIWWVVNLQNETNTQGSRQYGTTVDEMASAPQR